VLLGFIMIMLGIIGEYLWRIHDQVRERPMHVILTSEFAQIDSRDALDPQQGF
jgi:polyisoprenyl-phosphate glycosyltransferase